MTDAYKIGITVALTNLVGAELTQIAKQFGVAEKSAAGFGIALGVTAVAIAGVTAALVAGVNEARKFQVEVAKFSLMGMSDATNRDAQSFAENMKVVGTSATEAMKLVVEAQGIFRESGKEGGEALKSAKLFAPYMAKMDFVGKSLGGEGAGKLHSENIAMLRFIDMMGGNTSGARAKELVDFGFKLTESTGGNVNWEQLRQFRMHGRSAAANLTPEAMAKFEPIIQEYKGSAGTSLATAYMRINGLNKPPNQATHELVSSGLWDPDAVIWNKMGGIKQFKPGRNPLVDAELFSTDPIEWYQKHIVPLYEQRHYTQAQKIRENTIFFGRTGGDMFSAIDRQMSVIPGALDSYRKAKSLDEAVSIAHGTVDGKLVDLTAQWATLMKNIGMELLPKVNWGLQLLVDALNGINSLFGGSDGGAEKIQHGNSLSQSWSHWKSKLGFGGDAVPPPKKAWETPNLIMQMDKRTIGTIINQDTAHQLDRAAPGAGNRFDLRMSPLAMGH